MKITNKILQPIKPCICGRWATLIKYEEVTHAGTTYRVKCINCNYQTSHFQTAELAVIEWNCIINEKQREEPTTGLEGYTALEEDDTPF